MSAETALPGLPAWIAAVLALALAGVVPVLAALLERSGPIRLRHWAEEAGGRLQAVHESTERLEAFRFLLSTLARLLPVAPLAVLWLLLGRLGWPLAGVWALAGLALWLAAVETLNRVLAGGDPEGALRRLTGTYRLALMALTPAVLALAPLFRRLPISRKEDEDEVSDEEIEAFIDVGTREGILEPGEEDLILRVIDFGDAVVKSVVTPRIDMVGAPSDTPLEELAGLFLECKHSRVPLYRSSVDEIVGILHIRELLGGLRAAVPPPAKDLAHAPYVVPETKPLNELLREFQSQRQQMAIVVDEFGGTVGLVTVEDLLEEIVGEIVDEHEDLPRPSQPLADGSWKLDGGTPLDLLHKLFSAEVAEEPYETVGGFIFGRLGHLPEVGQQVELKGMSFTVERVEKRRIQSVIVRRLPAEEDAPS